MSVDVAIAPHAAPPNRGRLLSCRLAAVERSSRGKPVAFAGEFVLTNLSDAPLEIAHHLGPLQYLDLLVHDAEGRPVSEGHFADRFSPSIPPGVLRLEPGESFSAPVPLLATLSPARRAAGLYHVRAVYECAGLRVESEPVTVRVEAAA